MGQQFVLSQQKETSVSAMKTFIFIFSTINCSLNLLGLSSPKTYRNINLVFNAKQLEVFVYCLYFPKFWTLLLQKELLIIYCACKLGPNYLLSLVKAQEYINLFYWKPWFRSPEQEIWKKGFSNSHSVALSMPLGYLVFITRKTSYLFLFCPR